MKTFIRIFFILLISSVQISADSADVQSSSGATQGNAAQEQKKPASAEYHKISAQQAKARIDSGDKLIILDVRTEAEYNTGHIKNAIVLPNENIRKKKPKDLPDLNAEILIYCRSGNRSRQAALKLASMGYTRLYDFGGIIDWPYEIVKK